MPNTQTPAVDQLSIKIQELRALANTVLNDKPGLLGGSYPQNDDDTLEANAGKIYRKNQLVNNKTGIFMYLRSFTHQMDELRTAAAKSKFIKFKFANVKVLNECCDLTKTAVNEYIAYENLALTYAAAKRATPELNLDEHYKLLQEKQEKASAAITKLGERAKSLPSSKTTRNLGLSMMLVGAALLIGGIICTALSINSAIFAPPISAILAMVGVPSVLAGAGLLVAGSVLFTHRHQKNSGIDSIKTMKNYLNNNVNALSKMVKHSNR